MSTRRTKTQREAVVTAPRFRTGRPTASRRTSFVDQSVVTVARSSRSNASSVTSRSDGLSSVISVPLTLFEYGFPKAPPPDFIPNARFPAGPASTFMNSPAGKQLRHMEAEYTTAFSQFVNRSVRLAGARLLVLGSGASKVVTRYLVRGVASATFVDTSPEALASLSAHIATTGLEARVQTEYVNMDACDFLHQHDDAPYDVVVATKCVGLILSSAPSRTEATLLDLVTDVLAPDGSFFTDHHLAFSDPSISGQPVVAHAGDEYDLATICGRYSSDLCYSWRGMSSEAIRPVASYAIHSSKTLVQCWEMFHFRLDFVPPPTPRVAILPPRSLAPAGLTVPPPSGFDSVADAMIPLNNKGVKRVPTASDLSSHDASSLRLKFDGLPGVLQLQASVGVFVSPSLTFAFELNRSIEPGLTLMGELVMSSMRQSSIFVTGVVAVGDVPADPLDYQALAPLVTTLEALGPSGIAPSTPDLVRLVRGNLLQLTDHAHRVVQFPVDGVQVTTNGRGGVFMKPPSLTTVDATARDATVLFDRASASLGISPPYVCDLPADDGVWEFALTDGTNRWRPVRRRHDKSYSDNLGAVIHTLSAYIAGLNHHIGQTVESVVKTIGG